MSGIRGRLGLLILLALGPAVLLAVYTAASQEERIRTHIQEQAVRAAEGAAAAHGMNVERTRTLLQVLAESPELLTSDPAACRTPLARIRAPLPQYASLSVADTRGNVYCSDPPLPAPLNVADSDVFQEAVTRKGFSVGDYRHGRIAGRGVLPLGYPLTGAGGRVSAVLVASVDLQWLNQVVIRPFLLPGMTFTVLDRNGTVVAREPDSALWVGTHLPRSLPVRAILTRNTPGSFQGSDEHGVPTLYGFAPIGDQMARHRLLAVVSMPVADAFAEAERTLRRMLLTFAGIAAAVLVVGGITGERWIAGPVRTLRDTAHRLAAGDLQARSGLQDLTGELGELARAFDGMAASLERERSEIDRTTKLLHRSETRYRRLAENAPDIIYRYQVHPSARFEYVSPAVTAATGVTPAEHYANPGLALDLVHPDDRHIVEAILKGEHLGKRLRIRWIRRDGAEIWVEQRNVGVYDDGGRLVAIEGIARDVTDSVHLHLALQESQAHLSEALRIGGMGSWRWHIPTDRITWSDELCVLLGYDQTTAPRDQASLSALVHPDDRAHLDRALSDALTLGLPLNCEFRVRRIEGSYVVLHARAKVEVGESGQPAQLTATAQDVTEMRKMADALHRSSDELRSLSRRLVEMQESERQAIAHELHDQIGQLVTGLKFAVELAATHVAPAGEEYIRSAEQLVRDLGARVRTLTLDLRPPMLDDLGLLAALRWHVARYEEQTSIPVHLDAVERIDPISHTAAMACFRIVQEALTNVARHAGAQRIQLRVGLEGGVLRAEVEDDGRGFDQDALRSRESTGIIGMRERAEALGGRVTISSAPGTGTVVRLEVPVAAEGGEAV